MNDAAIYQNIKEALQAAPRNQYTAEMHLQMIKYADHLKTVTAKEFCEGATAPANPGYSRLHFCRPLY